MKRTVINHLSSDDNNSNNNQNNKSDNDTWESLFNSTRVFSYDSSGKFCAFAKFNHVIELWNMDCVLLPMIAFDCTKYLEQKEMICKSVIWSQDSTHIAVGYCRIDDAKFKYSYPSRVLIWNIVSQQFTSTLLIPVTIQSIIFLPQSNTQLCITGANQQILANPTSSMTTIKAEANIQQTAITETVLYHVDTIAKHMITVPLDTQPNQDSLITSKVLLEAIDIMGDNINNGSNNSYDSNSKGSNNDASSVLATKVLFNPQKSNIGHSIPSSSSSSNSTNNYHSASNISSSIILLSTSRFATVPSSSSSSSLSSSASLFYAVVTTINGIEVIQLKCHRNCQKYADNNNNNNNNNVISSRSIVSISNNSNNQITIHNNQITIHSRYKLNVARSNTSANITAQTTTDITAINNNSIHSFNNNNSTVNSTSHNNKITEVTHAVLSSSGQNLLLSLSTGQLIIVDLIKLNNTNNNNNHTRTDNDMLNTTTDYSMNNSCSIDNIDSEVKPQDQFISSLYEFTQHTERSSSQSSSSSSVLATPLISRHHSYYDISFIDNLPPIWRSTSISNNSYMGSAHGNNNDNNNNSNSNANDNSLNSYNNTSNIIEEDEYYYIAVATKYQPQALLSSSSSSSSFLSSTAGKILYLELRKQMPTHATSFSRTYITDDSTENVTSNSINNSNIDINSNGNNDEIGSNISQPYSAASSSASTLLQQRLYNRTHTIRISQSNILHTIPLLRASLIQSVTFRPNPTVCDNSNRNSNSKSDNESNQNQHNKQLSIQHQQITATTITSRIRLRDQILILSPFYYSKCTVYIHEPFYSTFESTFPGPMYPAGFRLLQQIVPYIEKEDELDVVVVTAASTVKEKAAKVGYNSNNITNGIINAPSSSSSSSSSLSTSSSSSLEVFIDVGTTANANNNTYFRNYITIDYNNVHISENSIDMFGTTNTSYLLDDDGNLCRLPFDYNHNITTSSNRNNNNNNVANTITNVSANSAAGIKKPFPTKTSSSSTTTIGKKRSLSVLNNNNKNNSSNQKETSTSAGTSVISNNNQQFAFNPFNSFFPTPRSISNNSFHRHIDINAQTAAVAHASLNDEKYMAEKHKQIQLEAAQSIQKIYQKRMREKQLRELKAQELRQQNKFKLEIEAQIQENNCMLREENLTRYYNVMQAMEIEYKLLKSNLLERTNSSNNGSYSNCSTNGNSNGKFNDSTKCYSDGSTLNTDNNQRTSDSNNNLNAPDAHIFDINNGFMKSHANSINNDGTNTSIR